MAKLIKCKACGAEIAKSAKTCPHCGAKNKKRGPWGIIIAVIVVIALVGSCSSKEGNEPVHQDSPVDTQGTTSPVSVSEAPKVTEEDIPYEYRAALERAKSYSEIMAMSKQGIYNQLVSEYGDKFSKEAAQYAIDNMEADWNANALAKAKSYSETMNMSKKAIYEQLISEHGELFTEEEAQYAIENVEADWKANALAKAKFYQEMNMSPAAILDQLVSEYGEGFTEEEADYAIENLEK